MIELSIGLDGVVSEKKINIGNKYENNDEVINFILPSEFDNYNKYIIAVIKQDDTKITKVLPVTNNQFSVSTSITYIAGTWSMYLMCRENEVDIDAEQVDISAKNGEHVFISDGFIGIVANSLIDKELIDNIPLDTNLHIIYDSLVRLQEELTTKLEQLESRLTNIENNISNNTNAIQETNDIVNQVGYYENGVLTIWEEVIYG